MDSDDAKAPDQDEDDLSDEDLVARLVNWALQSRQHSSKWREEAREDYNLVAGEQWAEQDKVALLDQMRQPITFNRTAPMVDAVTGAEILNRQEVHYVPRQQGRVQVSEMLTAADEWARELTDAEDEESDAFADCVISGMGWTETRMDYSEDVAGLIRIGRVDPLEMGWDPTAKQRNITDRRYHFRRKGFEKEEFKARFKEKAGQVLTNVEGQMSAEDDTDLDHRPPYDLYKDDNAGKGSTPSRLIYVTQFQWWELEPGYAVKDPASGEVTALSEEQYKASVKLMLQNGMQPMQAAKVDRKVYYEAFYSNNVLLSKRELKCGFTFHCVTGKRDRNKGTWYGVVRAMRDPQRWANKWLSQMLHIMNTNAKGGLMYETGAFANPSKALEEWSRPDSLTELKPGALARVQPKPPAIFPAGHEKMLEFAVESLPQVTGINMELLGLVQREQAGVLEQQRKRSGYAILAIYFDSLRRYRKLQGRTMLHFIQEYISDGRLIRVQHEEGYEQYVPLTRQPGVSTYDVIVDDAPMSQNQKDLVWGMLMQMMPILKDANLPPQIWSELVKYSPLPSVLSSKMAQAIGQPPSPEQQEMQQLQKAGAQAEVQGKFAKAKLDEARAQKEAAHAQQQPQQDNPLLIQAEAYAKMQDADGMRMVHESNAALNMSKAHREQQETAAIPFREHSNASVQAYQAQQKAMNDRLRAERSSVPNGSGNR